MSMPPFKMWIRGKKDLSTFYSLTRFHVVRQEKDHHHEHDKNNRLKRDVSSFLKQKHIHMGLEGLLLLFPIDQPCSSSRLH